VHTTQQEARKKFWSHFNTQTLPSIKIKKKYPPRLHPNELTYQEHSIANTAVDCIKGPFSSISCLRK